MRRSLKSKEAKDLALTRKGIEGQCKATTDAFIEWEHAIKQSNRFIIQLLIANTQTAIVSQSMLREAMNSWTSMRDELTN